MMPGRFFLGVGTGENLNEHILGDHWPSAAVRREMLEEAVGSERSGGRAMRVVVVGATGNVGTSVLRALADEDAVDSILGVARRAPQLSAPKTEWRTADISIDDLEPLFRGADAVVTWLG